jgi:uncharacterized protein with WD repeat
MIWNASGVMPKRSNCRKILNDPAWSFLKKEEKCMSNGKTKEQLLARKKELEEQLNEVNEDERIDLDNDMEEQAIEMEQHEVSVTMEENLRKELLEIEDKLLDLE